jgi:putative transposase
MAIPKRHALPPGTYFVTSRTWESRPLFRKKPLAQIFMATLFHYREEGAYRLHAFVLMPDHLHVLLTPGPDKALERVVQYIKGGSAHRIGKELSFTLPVWQRGFSDHRIRDAADYEGHLQYMDQNPVKRGLVASPREYPWGSASGRFALDEPPQRLKPPGVAPTG